MGSLKPWQLVLVIIAVLVLAVSLWMTVFSGSRVDFGDRVYMVDVATGELFYADTGGRRGVVVPAKHPATGARTIVPVQILEDGSLAISDRYRETVTTIIEKQQISISEQINEASGAISGNVGDAKKYTRPE